MAIIHDEAFAKKVNEIIEQKKMQATGISFGSINSKELVMVLTRAIGQANLVHTQLCTCGKKDCNLVNHIATWILKQKISDMDPLAPETIQRLTEGWKEYLYSE